MLHLPRFACALVLILATATAHASSTGECPESCLTIWIAGEVCSQRAAADTAHRFSIGNCADGASYDIPAGELSAFSEGWTLGPCGQAGATVRDEFTVGGVTPGTPLTFLARLDASFTALTPFGGAEASAGILQGETNSAGIDLIDSHSGGEIVDTTLTVSIDAVAGESFHVEFAVAIVLQGGEGEIHGAFSFEELPANATVTSCNGFGQGPVPSMPSSWGRVKSIYR
jgi:hypothetical protein